MKDELINVQREGTELLERFAALCPEEWEPTWCNGCIELSYKRLGDLTTCAICLQHDWRSASAYMFLLDYLEGRGWCFQQWGKAVWGYNLMIVNDNEEYVEWTVTVDGATRIEAIIRAFISAMEKDQSTVPATQVEGSEGAKERS